MWLMRVLLKLTDVGDAKLQNRIGIFECWQIGRADAPSKLITPLIFSMSNLGEPCIAPGT